MPGKKDDMKRKKAAEDIDFKSFIYIDRQTESTTRLEILGRKLDTKIILLGWKIPETFALHFEILYW